MSSSAAQRTYTFREYVEFEKTSELRYEFFAGAVYAMSGGSPEHSGIAANVIQLLFAQLTGKPCRVFTSDLRVRVLETGLATHLDVTVVCGTLARDPEDPHTITNPVVIIEVLSPTTERYDREEKFAHYRRIESLASYVLISQEEHRVEVFARNPDGSWTLRETRSGTAELAAIGCSLSVADVYQDPLVRWPTEARSATKDTFRRAGKKLRRCSAVREEGLVPLRGSRSAQPPLLAAPEPKSGWGVSR